MNRIHVVIGEQDERFLLHLANILENGFKEYVEAHCFSKPEYFSKFIGKNDVDVIFQVPGMWKTDAQSTGSYRLLV